MNKDALRKFYEQMLSICGLSIGDDDFLNTFYFDEDNNPQPAPMMVNGLGVIFPTDGVLREGKWKDRVGFHPLSESGTRGASPVLLSTAASMRFKIYQSIVQMGIALLKVTRDSRDGTVKNLPANLVEVLGSLPKTVDNKTLSFFCKVMAKSNDTDQAVVKICIKRNGSIQGTEYKRTTSIYFPIYEQLLTAIEKKEGEFWGIPAARKTDLVVVKELLEILMPDISDPDRYSAGSFNAVTPYLDCFIQAAGKAQDSINYTLELLDKYIPSTIRSNLQADTTWMEEETNYRDLRKVVPPLKFNEGEITEEEEKERTSDTTRVRPIRPEKSTEIPDFGAKAANTVRRVSEQTAPRQPQGGRRYIDNSLTDEERRDPDRAERRMSSDRYHADEDRYEYRGRRGRDDDDRRRGDRGRDSRRDDRDNQGRGRGWDEDRRSGSGGWLDRLHEDERYESDRGRGNRRGGRR